MVGPGLGRQRRQTASGTAKPEQGKAVPLPFQEKRGKHGRQTQSRGRVARLHAAIDEANRPCDVYAAYHGMGWYVMM